MTVSELIADLQKLPPDAIVCVYSDHGQATMKATHCGQMRVYTEKLKDFIMNTVHDDDVEDGEDYTTIVEISAP